MDEKELKGILDHNQQSPLASLGLSDDGNLFDDLLKSRPPQPTFGIRDFKNATEEARATVANLRQQSQADPDPDDEPAPSPQPEPQDEPQDPADVRAAEWLAQNHEQVKLRQRQEALERQAQQDREELRQQLARIERGQQPAARQEIDWDEFDWSDPRTHQAYRQHLENESRQQIQRQVHDATAPMLYRTAQANFQNALLELGKENEHFQKYYSKEQLNHWFAETARRIPVQQLANIDFRAEWSNALKVMDYERLKKENDDLRTAKTATSKIEKERESQKRNLQLVPKASSQSAPTARKAPQSTDGLPNFADRSPFSALSEKFKKQLAT